MESIKTYQNTYSKKIEKYEKTHAKNMAYFYMTMCAFNFAICGLSFKLLYNLPAMEILTWRCVITIIWCYFWGDI